MLVNCTCVHLLFMSQWLSLYLWLADWIFLLLLLLLLCFLLRSWTLFQFDSLFMIISTLASPVSSFFFLCSLFTVDQPTCGLEFLFRLFSPPPPTAKFVFGECLVFLSLCSFMIYDRIFWIQNYTKKKQRQDYVHHVFISVLCGNDSGTTRVFVSLYFLLFVGLLFACSSLHLNYHACSVKTKNDIFDHTHKNNILLFAGNLPILSITYYHD